MCFIIFWTALLRYTWLSNSSRFFSNNQCFRMFLISMANIIGSYERSRRCKNNDAVRAVAVAKRREYCLKQFMPKILTKLCWIRLKNCVAKTRNSQLSVNLKQRTRRILHRPRPQKQRVLVPFSAPPLVLHIPTHSFSFLHIPSHSYSFLHPYNDSNVSLLFWIAISGVPQTAPAPTNFEKECFQAIKLVDPTKKKNRGIHTTLEA